MEKRVLKLLHRSLDSVLKKKDRERLDKALAESEELRRHGAEMLSLRQSLAQSAAQSFGPRFEDRVMSRIRSASKIPRKYEALAESYRWVFGRLVAISIFILIALLSMAVVQDGLFPKDALFYMPDTTIARILQMPVF